MALAKSIYPLSILVLYDIQANHLDSGTKVKLIAQHQGYRMFFTGFFTVGEEGCFYSDMTAQALHCLWG